MRKYGHALMLAALLAMGACATASASPGERTETYDGRDMIVYVPDRLPPSGERALVVVLHGGLGNAERVASERSESGMNMNAEAARDGFVVAYLNGTRVARLLRSNRLGWNAGDCCGLAAERKVDDVGYITGAVRQLADEYGIDRRRVYGIGHSNGAMMTQRMLCATDVYAAGIAISGPLELDVASCPAARGKTILAIHGADDRNVPITGGKGTKGLSGVKFHSEAETEVVYKNSGASYDLQVVAADHKLNHIDEALQKSEGVTLAEKAAAFFGLRAPGR